MENFPIKNIIDRIQLQFVQYIKKVKRNTITGFSKHRIVLVVIQKEKRFCEKI